MVISFDFIEGQHSQYLFFNNIEYSNLFPKWQVLYSSKLKEFADDNSIFDEMAENLCKWLANTVRKGEIACYKQFLLLQQCFQKTCTADM